MYGGVGTKINMGNLFWLFQFCSLFLIEIINFLYCFVDKFTMKTAVVLFLLSLIVVVQCLYLPWAHYQPPRVQYHRVRNPYSWNPSHYRGDDNGIWNNDWNNNWNNDWNNDWWRETNKIANDLSEIGSLN